MKRAGHRIKAGTAPVHASVRQHCPCMALRCGACGFTRLSNRKATVGNGMHTRSLRDHYRQAGVVGVGSLQAVGYRLCRSIFLFANLVMRSGYS